MLLFIKACSNPQTKKSYLRQLSVVDNFLLILKPDKLG